jgi:hypothetical protein
MKVPKGPLFQPLDIALIAGFAMGFVMLVGQRLV